MKLSSSKNQLDSVLHQAVAENRIVGTVVQVRKNGTVVYEGSAGYADREAGTVIGRDAIFRLASVTKLLVSVATLALIDGGVLRLDDPVTRWLPAFRPKLPDGTEPVITVRHLLTHTAGLTYGFNEAADGPYHKLGVSDALDMPGFSQEENLRRLASAPLLFAPGTQWNYSLATDVLGAVIEQATGAPLPEVVARYVTGPLGLRDTAFGVTDTARLVVPYADGDPVPVRMTDDFFVPNHAVSGVRYAPGRIFDATAYPSGGAGMAGTAGDIGTLLEALRCDALPGITSTTWQEATRDQVPPVELGTQGPGWGFGYGWAVLNDPAPTGTPQSAGTIAWGGAYGHTWFVDPKHGLSVVALTNTTLEGLFGAFPIQVRDAVYADFG